MNYQNIYNKIIQNRRKTPLSINEYGEHHHIIPKSLGGPDDETNIIKLTAREHFLCHFCLVKMQIPNTIEWMKMYFAFQMFKTKKLKYINSRLYERLKIQASENYKTFYSGENSSNNGKKKYTNGTRDIYLCKNDIIPEGFYKGSCIKFNWINNGIKNKRLAIGEPLPENYEFGKIVPKNKHIWVTNGMDTIRIKAEENIPEGYERGTSLKSTTGKIWINNGIENKMIEKNDEIPLGYIKGKLKKSTMADRTWYTNGTDNKMLKSTDIIPEGFYKGKTTRALPFKRYTNGKENIIIRDGEEIPEGFYFGISRTYRPSRPS